MLHNCILVLPDWEKYGVFLQNKEREDKDFAFIIALEWESIVVLLYF